MALIVPATGLFLASLILTEQGAGKGDGAPLLVHAPETTSLELPSVYPSGELQLYEFPRLMRDAYIHDIVVDGDRLWIGTGKGLLEHVDGKSLTRHRQFSHAPFEWVENLALADNLLALDVHVARGSSGGHRAGSHVLDTRSGQWQKVGRNILDQTWLKGVLWQRPLDRNLLKTSLNNGQWTSEEVPLRTQLCSEAYMSTINDEIWIAQQGTVHFHGGAGIQGMSHVKAKPCGVLRYNPLSGEETLYGEGHGLNSGFGRDIAGDEHQVWVSHSIKDDRLSLFDTGTGRWQSARPYGSGNRITLGDRAVWLASPSSTSPLIRIDGQRKKGKTSTVCPLSSMSAPLPSTATKSGLAFTGKPIATRPTPSSRIWRSTSIRNNPPSGDRFMYPHPPRD
jgi:hypothetical protein